MSNLVSVIIPTYNRINTLGRALDSILIQDYRPLEIIVIDDASTDNTQQFLKQYEYEKISRNTQGITLIKFMNRKNLGIGNTRNVGLRHAKGEYIAFLDSDDEWIRPDKISLQINFLERNLDYGFIATATKVINSKFPPNFLGESDDQDFRKNILSWCPYQTSSWLLKKDVIQKAGFFWHSKCEDYEYLLRIGSITRCGGLGIIANCHYDGDGYSSSNRIKCYFATLYIIFVHSLNYPHFLNSLTLRLLRGFTYGLRFLRYHTFFIW